MRVEVQLQLDFQGPVSRYVDSLADSVLVNKFIADRQKHGYRSMT